MKRVFITGGLGCLGAWIVKNLLEKEIEPVVFDLATNRQRLALIMRDENIENVVFVHGDITDPQVVRDAVSDNGISHIIHLAALQVPSCKANPPAGAAVNVGGTVNVFEAAKAAGIKNLIYASSIAVYGGKDEYDSVLLAHDAPLNPHTHYGVFKQANEATARIYWQDDGIASIGLRPYTLYGPGRDQGLTSSPTKAMLAAARGENFHIPYGGTTAFQYNDDVAKIFIQAAGIEFTGAEVFNLGGTVAHMSQVISAIEAAESGACGMLTFADKQLDFPQGMEDDALRALLGDIPSTPLEEGVTKTIKHFKRAAASGLLQASGERQ